MPNVKILPQTVVVAAEEQVSADLAGEAAVLNLKNGVYYGLNAVGARIWNLLQQARTVNEIRDHLLAEYDVEGVRCEADLYALLEKLAAEGLIKIRNETSA